MCDGKPRNTVVFYNICGPKYRASVRDKPSHEKYANVGEDDCITLTGVEEDRRGCRGMTLLVRGT